MDTHEHPDLLDEAIEKKKGLRMRMIDRLAGDGCPHCGSRKLLYTGDKKLFDWFCTWCDTSF